MSEYRARELAAAIVGHMPGWSVEPKNDDYGDHGARIANTDGVRLYVRHDAPRKRLEFQAAYPYRNDIYFRDGEVSRAEITVSAERAPEAIAKDVLRRCVPDATEGFKKWNEAIEKQDAAYAKHADVVRELVEEFPELHGNSSRHANDREMRELRWYGNNDSGNTHGKVSLNYGADGGSVELSGLSVSQIKRILRMAQMPR